MAEIVVSAFLTVFFEKLASEAVRKEVEEKEITNEAVKAWLNGLQHLAYDIDDLLDDLETEAMHRELTKASGATTSKVRKLISTCCTNFSIHSRMHGKLDDITRKLRELVEEKDNLGLSVKGESPKIMNRRLQTSLVDPSSVVGRDSDKDALLHKLLGYESRDKNFSIVPIVGMGGVGKTTLARLLYDKMQGNDHFELKAWVCVSDEFDIFNISKTIFQSIDGGNQEFKDLNLLQVALKEKISKKQFLFVLDDVWSESYTEWEILTRPFLAGASGSKIIMTTRKLSLLTQLGYNQPYNLSVLSHENALSLFCEHALGERNFDSYPTLKPYGEGIVAKCDGLPLALIALGRLLRTKTDEVEWKELLNSEIWKLGKRDEIIPALRLSYLDLSSSLKLLFAYCSLFPKDYVFDKEHLVLLWMAEGFLHQSATSKAMQRLGLEYFEELLSRSFFQHAPNDKSLFVMHDLMNDLATSIAGDFFSRLDVGMKKEFRKEALANYRHMSFVCEHYMLYNRFEAFKGAKSLRTFLAVSFVGNERWGSFYLSNTVLTDLLHELPLLRVLSLSHLSISEVPEFIGSLKHLRYLNLSYTEITHLPDNVCNLYNLQTLIVFGCDKLKKLANNFSRLKNLSHFDIRDTPLLKEMPFGIGELKSLRTLPKIIIGGGSGFSITKLKYLKDFQGKMSLNRLDKVRSPIHTQEVNFSQRRLSELEVEWSDVFDYSRKKTLEKEVLNVLKPHNDTLKQLRVVSYGGIEFPNWVADPSFHQLAHLSIEGCKTCASLPPLGQLPSLKKLFIKGMDNVKVVGPEFLGTCIPFPSLEILSFQDMHGWEVWSTNNSGAFDTVFPCLQELLLDHCHKLVDLSLEELPSLRILKISECGHQVLGSLVRVASSVTKLDIKHISGVNDQVWGGVIKYLGAVEKVEIIGCNEIRYLWESEAKASKVLVNLRELDVSFCSNLVTLGEKENDKCVNNLTSLTRLVIQMCKSFEHCSCPKSIEYLRLFCCPSATSVSFPTGGQKLKLLWIMNCEKLLENEFIGGGEKTRLLINSNMRMLEFLDLYFWPNLKSITELSSFNHLTGLIMEGCRNLASFPDHELPKLTLLKHLTVVNCQSMDASFPRGLWPPNLSSLKIGGLKKPISEWGPQNFPTSLVELELQGGRSEEVSSFNQLSHLFPSSLTSLHIEEFDKLESLAMGLQHLTALQHLHISDCPKLRDLPETLFASLLSLRIYHCPKLKELCSRRGSYWPLVTRIPCCVII